MSNAKWIKLFKATCAFHNDVPQMNYKLVYNEDVYNSFTEQYEEQVDDYWFIEPSMYKEIEWVEFPFEGNGDMRAFESAISKLAQFPIITTETGIRVIGYEKA